MTPLWSQYVTNGTAVPVPGDGDCFRLTEAVTSQGGSVWFQNKISLNSDFRIVADLNLGDIDSLGADGIAFVFQPICTGLGSLGGGLGYQGISPSLAVEFDTWFNAEHNDPLQDHIALQKNGIVDHSTSSVTVPDNLAGPFPLSNIEDGAFHPAVITWTAASKTLSLTFDGASVFIYTDDIVANIFSGNPEVYWGFTAATGALINTQIVCVKEVTFEELVPYEVTDAGCPNTSDGAIDFTPAGGPYTFLWNTGATTEDLADIPAGTYILEVKDTNNCVSTYTIEVGFEPDLTPPVITCPADTVVVNDTGLCGAVVTYTAPVGTDECPDPLTVLSSGLGSGALFPVGITTEWYTVTDAGGNRDSCSFTIEVVDEEAPVLTCAADTTISCEVPTDPPGTGLSTATDNCGMVDLTFADVVTPGDCPQESFISRTWTAKDPDNNESTCIQEIKVVDETAPVISCPPDLTVACNMTEDLSVTGMATATDNCDPAPVLDFTDAVVSGDCRWECTIERTWEARDACDNVSTCVQTITSTALPLIEDALSMDTDGDGVADPIVLGESYHTLTIGLEAAPCVIRWMPAANTEAPHAMPRERYVVDPADCVPGGNGVDPDGKILNPLLSETLIMAINLRLTPGLAETPLDTIDCPFDPFLNQFLRPSTRPTVADLFRLANLGLGNLIGPPPLEAILEALRCINSMIDICDPSMAPRTALTTGTRDGQKLVINLLTYPNPAGEVIYADLSAFSGHKATLQLFSPQGKLLETLQVEALPEAPVALQLRGYPQGLFLLQVHVEGKGMASVRFIGGIRP